MKYMEMTKNEYAKLLQKEREWKYYNNFATYLKEHQEESGDYLRLQPYEVNTLSRIYIDSCCSFIYNNHPLWMYAECEINEEIDKLPIRISKYPQVLINCNINEEQQRIVDSAKTFIIKNTSVLEMYALENVDIIDFFKAIRTQQTLSENLLMEMPKLDDTRTGLNTTIWVDNERPKGHTNRIKFQDTRSNNSHDWASMTIDKFNPIVKNLHKDTFLKPSDIERIKRFVILNYDILNSLATDKSFNYEKQFLPYIIKLGKGEGYIIPQERFADNTNHTIYISCSVTDDRLWFMTNDNNQNTEHLMIEIGNTEPFEFFDKYTVYVDLNKHRDVVANIFNLGEIIKKIATNYNINVTLTNLNSIIKTYGF